METGKMQITDQQISKLCRKAAAQGAVLLKNKDAVLPLSEKDHIAVFGRCQIEYYRSGTGSGGAVNVPYTTNFIEGLRENQITVNEELAGCYLQWIEKNPFDNGGGGWACEPWCQQEMPVDKALVSKAAETSNKAIVVVGRTAGEDKDNAAAEGSYFLTQDEKEMLHHVCEGFENVVVVLNVSNIIDMGFVEDNQSIKAVVCAWQGGMEGGNGIADVLAGKEVFQGKLTDTIARKITDYPSDKNHGGSIKNVYQEDIYVGYRYFETFAKEAVLYPFGYGLSYTEFDIYDCAMKISGSSVDTKLMFTCKVKNTGTKYNGREIVQLYVEKPANGMGRPVRELIGFAKTRNLDCLEEEEIQIEIPVYRIASFDDSGVSGYKNSYVLETGEYHFHAGANVRDTVEVSVNGAESWQIKTTQLIEECKEALAPAEPFERMCTFFSEDGAITLGYESVPTRTENLRERILSNLPGAVLYSGNKGFILKDVAEGKCTMEAFIAQLSPDDLAAIVRGEGMCSIKVTPGTAAAFGGVSDNLLGYGIPVGCCADGPSGIRMDNGSRATQVPIGTLIACTWDEVLAEDLFACIGEEMVQNQVDTLLGPGINIHRHPLNGRNFEYFSEDPLLTGKIAAAVVRGIGSKGVHATIKHYACNSQETGRHIVNSVVSQRALREIYLKAFEIAVREGNAQSVMTSYNPVNGYWTASNYDLNTTILREEWGFGGIVMTDWWAQINDVVDGGEGSRQRTADMVRAQNDIYMVVNNNGAEINAFGDDTIEALYTGRLTIGELQRSAMNICRFLMNTPAFGRSGNGAATIPFIKAVSTDGQTESDMDNGGRIQWNTSVPAERYFYIKEAGYYDVIVRLMSPQTDRAQTVCKALLNEKEFATFQTNGTQGRWMQQKLLRAELEKGSYQIKLLFPKPGMEIDYMEFRPCDSMN
ncbi:MAG: glycoside hydrolase family 3 C-terminal domain-containing protein [Lachnospiraceae bacterium]|nr:glycoside hydrolase family 3 C-terminal domain-containing protein [Lachnospiraceae bacterium]